MSEWDYQSYDPFFIEGNITGEYVENIIRTTSESRYASNYDFSTGLRTSSL